MHVSHGAGPSHSERFVNVGHDGHCPSLEGTSAARWQTLRGRASPTRQGPTRAREAGRTRLIPPPPRCIPPRAAAHQGAAEAGVVAGGSAVIWATLNVERG